MMPDHTGSFALVYPKYELLHCIKLESLNVFTDLTCQGAYGCHTMFAT